MFGAELARATRRRYPAATISLVSIPRIKDFARNSDYDKFYELTSPKLEYVLSDITTYDFCRSNFIVCYYVLQFLSFSERIKVLQSIYNCLEPGGALIIFEKVLSNHSQIQEIISSLYIDYKLENKYVPEEILRKENSLRGVLNSWSTENYFDLLSDLGFKKKQTIMKYLCFEGMIAIK